MPRFFVDKNNINARHIIVNGSDAVHIGRSLRMRLGDIITLCCDGVEYESKIITISDEQVDCEIVSSKQGETEPNIKLTLYQAVPKSDKLEFIVQKAVELGAVEIVPVLTSRCVSRPDKKSFKKKLERLNKIALEAAKQCGRSVIPVVSDIISFDECINDIGQKDLKFICYEKGGKNLRDAGLVSGKTVGIFIGSEGGFDSSEAEKCIENGVAPIGLGSRILRCETAPVAAISIIMNITGNM